MITIPRDCCSCSALVVMAWLLAYSMSPALHVNGQEADARSTGGRARLKYAGQKSLAIGDARGTASLTMSPAAGLPVGDQTALSIEFHNTSGAGTPLFNPFFTKLLPIGCRVAVFDSDRRHVGNVPLQRDAGSRRWPGRGDWLTLRGNSRLTVQIAWEAGVIRPIEFGQPTRLPPGRYEAQVVYTELAFCPPAVGEDCTMDSDEHARWSATAWKPDVCRTQRVPFEIVADPIGR